jgi:hypothetical protein
VRSLTASPYPSMQPVLNSKGNPACRAVRCEECIGCKQDSCGWCSGCRGNRGCAFRPCTNFAPKTLSKLHCYALSVLETRKTTPTTDKKCHLDHLFDTLYGKGTWAASKSKCMACSGCTRQSCGICKPCQGLVGTNTGCVFTKCEKFSYAPSSWNKNRQYAACAVRDARNGSSKSPLDLKSVYESTYGKQGVAAKAFFKRTLAVAVGTRVYCLWPENEVSSLSCNQFCSTYTSHLYMFCPAGILFWDGCFEVC